MTNDRLTVDKVANIAQALAAATGVIFTRMIPRELPLPAGENQEPVEKAGVPSSFY